MAANNNTAQSLKQTADLKRAAAARALDFVGVGMKLGRGTGSTAEVLLEL